MPTLRVYRVTAASPAAPPKLRVYKVSATGTAPSAPKLRVYKVSATGVVAPVLNPLPNLLIEPMTAGNTVTATTALGSSVPDGYSWRVISGGPMTLVGTWDTITFTTPAPPPPNQQVITIGVKATTAGTDSAEQTFTVTVPVQLNWTYVGGVWTGLKRVAL
jgi:hypothetical protein